MPTGAQISVLEKREQNKKKSPIPIPIYAIPTAPHESALRKFICLPDETITILGPRREPPIACPPTNTDTSIAVLTSVGFTQLDATEYVEAIQRISPDIVIGLADLVTGQPPGIKRRTKMVDRTHAFTAHATDNLYGPNLSEHSRSTAAYFAPILPLENTQQQLYLEDLETDVRAFISGLALYESESLSIVPELLGDLPRLLFGGPRTPREILRQIEFGADLVTIPFLNLMSDLGMAFNFAFPTPSSSESNQPTEPLPLADDLWSSSNTTDTSPLNKSCSCYTCQNHHRAYIHHLLSAKELLAWTLLQIHNHYTMDLFFSSIRDSIQRGTFDEDIRTFQETYAPEFPEATGQGPRYVFFFYIKPLHPQLTITLYALIYVTSLHANKHTCRLRGYQLPASSTAQPRRYPPAYGRLDLAAQKFAESQSEIATPDTGASGLEEHGFAEKA